MITCLHPSVLFIHNPKTGGISTEAWLRGRCGRVFEDGPRHETAQEARARVGETVWGSHYSFGVVRNPWARLVSWWSMIRSQPHLGHRSAFWQYVLSLENFEAFVRSTQETDDIGSLQSAARPQLQHFTDDDGHLIVDFVGRFEHLEEDLREVARQCQMRFSPLPRKNVGQKLDYRSYYSPETRQLIAERFAVDIERFDYHF